MEQKRAMKLVDALCASLASRGIDRAFGIPGNHNLDIYAALQALDVPVLGSRHEQGAAFMADGYARVTGKPGLVAVIDGPGFTNASTAIVQARNDSVPMVVLTPAQGDTVEASGVLHQLPDQSALAAQLCLWSIRVNSPASLEAAITRLDRTLACERPGPVHIEIDTKQSAQGSEVPVSTIEAVRPDVVDVERAKAILVAAAKPLVICGGGSVNAADEVVRIATELDAPVLNTVNAKGILALDHPLRVGGSPSLPSLRRALASADAVLAVGTEIGETDYDLLMTGAPESWNGLVRIDIDKSQLQCNLPAEVAIHADASNTLRDLRFTGSNRHGASRARELREGIGKEKHCHSEYLDLLEVLRSATDVLVGDSTQPTYYASWLYEPAQTRSYFHSVSGFGTLGYAIPAAIGAKAGAPDARVTALIGDGGAQFTFAEIAAAVHHGLNITVVVWSNDGYAEIEHSMAARQMVTADTKLVAPDFCAMARAMGAHAANAADLQLLRDAMAQSRLRDVPTVIVVRESDFISQPGGQWYG